MIKRKEVEKALELIDKYEKQQIKNHNIKTGDLYRYRNQVMSVNVYFDVKKDKIWYNFKQPNNYKIENGEIRFYRIGYSNEEILENGVKFKQISGEKLERLKELNEMALYDYDNVDSKKEQELLENERNELLKFCCHDFKNVGGFSYEEYTCKTCNYTIKIDD